VIKKIKDLFTNVSSVEVEDEDKLIVLNNACAALLIEVAFADKVFNELEISSLKLSLKEIYNIEEETIENLVLEAEETVEQSTSLYEYTKLINNEFSYNDKLLLLERLWVIAFSDDNLDKHEEYLVRKISDLIHISHSDFIRLKLKARDN
tara:strand:+ start:3265 stop:3714 length:450 start_codon:yes stop_codon:yes gene_type:complete